MKIYVSGKISGTTDYKERFQKAEELIKTEMKTLYPEVVNPVKLCEEKGVKNWTDCMKICIAALMQCDAIYMQKGFSKSNGAMLEFSLAMRLDMLIYSEQQSIFIQEFLK